MPILVISFLILLTHSQTENTDRKKKSEIIMISFVMCFLLLAITASILATENENLDTIQSFIPCSFNL